MTTYVGNQVLFVPLECEESLGELEERGGAVFGAGGHQAAMFLDADTVQWNVTHLQRE